MTQTITRYQQYDTDYKSFSESKAQPEWVQSLRESGWARFQDLGLPTARRGNEPWKYTNIAPIAEASLTLAQMPGRITLDEVKAVAPWDDGWTNMVFVDGIYVSDLSSGASSGVAVTSLAEAIATSDELVRINLGQAPHMEEDDGFVSLNNAFLRDGAVLHIREGKTAERPVHLLFISTATEQATVSYPRILVVGEANSKATIIESYVGLSDSVYLTNAMTEITLAPGAELEHYRLLIESENAFHVGYARVDQAANSIYKSKVFERNVGLGRFDLYTRINGENSSCEMKGLYYTSGSQHMDNYININHEKPHGTSRLYYKGILDGRSRAVFGGTVYVQPGAIKTDSRQEDKNLVLSPNAEVDSKPALFIWADDVVCGHGATAGNIDEDTVFYMRARGLDLEAASRLLIYGFAGEIIEAVEEKGLRSYLEQLFLESLPSYKFEF
jgi:Fe-S cluster assembly protein SufD